MLPAERLKENLGLDNKIIIQTFTGRSQMEWLSNTLKHNPLSSHNLICSHLCCISCTWTYAGANTTCSCSTWLRLKVLAATPWRQERTSDTHSGHHISTSSMEIKELICHIYGAFMQHWKLNVNISKYSTIKHYTADRMNHRTVDLMPFHILILIMRFCTLNLLTWNCNVFEALTFWSLWILKLCSMPFDSHLALKSGYSNTFAFGYLLCTICNSVYWHIDYTEIICVALWSPIHTAHHPHFESLTLLCSWTGLLDTVRISECRKWHSEAHVGSGSFMLFLRIYRMQAATAQTKLLLPISAG